MTQTPSILLIGAGKMGGALLNAWIARGWPAGNITVMEKNDIQVKELAAKGIFCAGLLEMVPEPPACVVLAVKPQSLDEVTRELAGRFGSAPLYLSIAAGKTIGYFEKHLGADAAIVRAMPNTPALIGEGISALVANARATDEQKKLAENLLGAAGHTVWLDDESQIDAVTAISGSGPAYMFLFLDALIAAGQQLGLEEKLAHTLALQTMRGSAALAQRTEEKLTQLRKNVTSPGGTTEAALQVLMRDDVLMKLVQDAATAAVKRAKELG